MSARTFQTDVLSSQVAEALAYGATLGELRGYTDEECEGVYVLGHRSYANARYLDALKAFGFLVMNNPYERRFVRAYASTLHMLMRYEDAIAYYSMASAMDMRDPVPTFHTAECLLALRMVAEAKQALGFVESQCTQPHQMALKERAMALLKLLSTPSREREESNGGLHG